MRGKILKLVIEGNPTEIAELIKNLITNEIQIGVKQDEVNGSECAKNIIENQRPRCCFHRKFTDDDWQRLAEEHGKKTGRW